MIIIQQPPLGGVADSDEKPPLEIYSQEEATGEKSFFIQEGDIPANRFPRWVESFLLIPH